MAAKLHSRVAKAKTDTVFRRTENLTESEQTALKCAKGYEHQMSVISMANAHVDRLTL